MSAVEASNSLAAWRALALQSPQPSAINIPNGVTLTSFLLGLSWIYGGPAWLGILGLAADQLYARISDESDVFGHNLDWTADASLAMLELAQNGWFFAMPPVIALQLMMRNGAIQMQTATPRAALTIYSIVTDW